MLLTLAVVLGAPARARADGLSAPAAAVADGGLRDSTVKLGVVGGTSGAWVTAGFSIGFEYVSYDYSGRALETGAGLRFNPIGPLLVWAAGSAIIAPLGGDSGGGRLAAGIAARFGNRWFIRPGAGLAFGILGSRLPPTFLLPLEASLEAGYTWPFLSPYLRVSGGLDPIAKELPTARWAVCLGLSIPVGPTME